STAQNTADKFRLHPQFEALMPGIVCIDGTERISLGIIQAQELIIHPGIVIGGVPAKTARTAACAELDRARALGMQVPDAAARNIRQLTKAGRFETAAEVGKDLRIFAHFVTHADFGAEGL